MNCIKAYKLKKAPNRRPRSVVCATSLSKLYYGLIQACGWRRGKRNVGG